MDGIKFYKKPHLKSPYFICAWPGMGEVAFRAATYLAEKLKAEEFAEIPSADFFYLSGSVIKDGVLDMPQLPSNKFYYWKNKEGKNDLVIFISNAQPDLTKAEEYCRRILSVARGFKAKMIVSFAAMPQAIEHQQQPGVWFATTSSELNNSLRKYNFNLLSEGQISGMNGLFLGLAKREGLGGFCLLGEIPLYTIQIPNPKASHAVLEGLSRVLNLKIDFTSLLDEGHAQEQEINKLLEYLQIGAPAGPIGEEEIERIKKSLAQLSKLPLSVKRRIDELFKQAKDNITLASELKNELDKWNVYKEYEDKFLDLFKKKEDKNN